MIDIKQERVSKQA